MKTCDCCDETWEESFFCEKCSNKIDWIWKMIESEEPILDWCGYGDDFEMVEIEVYTGDVCMNCCNCNLQ